VALHVPEPKLDDTKSTLIATKSPHSLAHSIPCKPIQTRVSRSQIYSKPDRSALLPQQLLVATEAVERKMERQRHSEHALAATGRRGWKGITRSSIAIAIHGGSKASSARKTEF